MSSRRGFTLIELLVVIAILAILAVVVVLTLNPAELLRQSRDSQRVSDMATLNSAIGLYNTDQSGSQGFSMGNASSVYVSLTDTTSTCANLGLASLPTGDTYACASSTSSRTTNGSGWIPINFSTISAGSPLGSLPMDPTNQSSSGLYYTYATNGTQYEVTSLFESQKYKAQYGQSPLDPDYPEVNAKGSSLAVSPLFNPAGLVGWWPLTEGSGSSSIDQSGNGNNGTWNGTAGGTNGTYYTGGKVGSYAGSFDGSTDYISAADAPSLDFGTSQNFSVSAWVNTQSKTNLYQSIVIHGGLQVSNSGAGALGPGYMLAFRNCCGFLVRIGDGSTISSIFYSYTSDSQWHNIIMTCSRTGNMTIYFDGVPVGTANISSIGSVTNSGPLWIGQDGSGERFPGSIDDVRIYNRALSAAEVQAMYQAEK